MLNEKFNEQAERISVLELKIKLKIKLIKKIMTSCQKNIDEL